MLGSIVCPLGDRNNLCRARVTACYLWASSISALMILLGSPDIEGWYRRTNSNELSRRDMENILDRTPDRSSTCSGRAVDASPLSFSIIFFNVPMFRSTIPVLLCRRVGLILKTIPWDFRNVKTGPRLNSSSAERYCGAPCLYNHIDSIIFVIDFALLCVAIAHSV